MLWPSGFHCCGAGWVCNIEEFKKGYWGELGQDERVWRSKMAFENFSRSENHAHEDFSGFPKVKRKSYSSEMKQSNSTELLGYSDFII